MKCLSREEIQLLIDHQPEHEQSAAFRLHIAGCARCRALYSQATEENKQVAGFFKQYQALLEKKEIPEFEIPKPKRSLYFLQVAASVAITVGITTALFFVIPENKHLPNFKPNSVNSHIDRENHIKRIPLENPSEGIMMAFEDEKGVVIRG